MTPNLIPYFSDLFKHPESIEVSSTGEANRIHDTKMGKYTKVDGLKYNNNHVWKHSSGSHFVFHTGNKWAIGPDFTDINGGSIRSIGGSNPSIEGHTWEHMGDDSNWHQDQTLTVKSFYDGN